MIKKALICSLILLNGMSGCAIFQSRNGILSLAVSFPQKAFSLKVIPKDTSKIKVEVTGEGLTSAIDLNLSITSPESTITVPSGKKQVKATALNDAGKTLATASESINIIANTNNTVRVKLQPVQDSVAQ
jgi:hypothetical protein